MITFDDMAGCIAMDTPTDVTDICTVLRSRMDEVNLHSTSYDLMNEYLSYLSRVTWTPEKPIIVRFGTSSKFIFELLYDKLNEHFTSELKI